MSTCDHNINLLRDTAHCGLVKTTYGRPSKIVMDEEGIIRAYDQWDNFIGLATVDENGVVTIRNEES